MIRKGDKEFKLLKDLILPLTKMEKVLDVGTSQRFAKELDYFRNEFQDNYSALGYKPDMNFGKDNCDFDGDAMNLEFPDNFWDATLCIEVLEHVPNPQKVVDELRRVTKMGGSVILSTPFMTSYHGKMGGKSGKHTEYPDYFRYTHQGLEYLFREFSEVEVYPVGGKWHYLLVVLQLNKYKLLKWMVDIFDKPVKGKATIRHFVKAVK